MNTKFLQEILQDNDGSLSMMRFANIIIVGCAAFDWIHSIIKLNVWHPDFNTILLVMGAMGWKAVQKFAESQPKQESK